MRRKEKDGESGKKEKDGESGKNEKDGVYRKKERERQRPDCIGADYVRTGVLVIAVGFFFFKFKKTIQRDTSHRGSTFNVTECKLADHRKF